MTDYDNAKLAAALASQDCAGTADPIFFVQRHRRTYGFDTAYSDKCVFIDDEGNEVSDFGEYQCQECDKTLTAEDLNDEKCSECHEFLYDTGLTRTSYQDTWEHVQPFLTRTGAEEYLRANAHNLDGKEKPRIYVDSAYRNGEWQAMRRLPARIEEALALLRSMADDEETDAVVAAYYADAARLVEEVLRGDG